jgi:hypothetical protein
MICPLKREREREQPEQKVTRLVLHSTMLFVNIHDSSMRLRPLHTDCRADGVVSRLGHDVEGGYFQYRRTGR